MLVRNTFLCFEESEDHRPRSQTTPSKLHAALAGLESESEPPTPASSTASSEAGDLDREGDFGDANCAPGPCDTSTASCSGRSTPAPATATPSEGATPSCSGRSSPTTAPTATPAESVDPWAGFAPALQRLLRRPAAGQTTVMLKNVPFACTQGLLLRLLRRAGAMAGLDLFYLPMDLKKKINMGYAFANFTSEAHAQQFCATVDGLRLEEFRKAKPLKTCVARVQGFNANFRNFRKSSNIGTRHVPEYRPVIVDPETASEIPFPALEKNRQPALETPTPTYAPYPPMTMVPMMVMCAVPMWAPAQATFGAPQ